jgi:hypothetical protein
MLHLWQQSGLTIFAFCVRHKLSRPSFYAWQRTIAQRDRTSFNPGMDNPNPGKPLDAEPLFVPVRIVPALTPPLARGTPLELVLSQGRVVRVTPGFDAATLRQLLDVLEGPTC